MCISVGWSMNQGKVVVAGTVVRAPMLINCDPGPSFHSVATTFWLINMRQVLVDTSTIHRLVLLFAYLEILSWCDPTCSILLYPSFAVLVPWRVITRSRRSCEGEEESDVHEPGTRAESNARFAYIYVCMYYRYLHTVSLAACRYERRRLDRRRKSERIPAHSVGGDESS